MLEEIDTYSIEAVKQKIKDGDWTTDDKVEAGNQIKVKKGSDSQTIQIKEEGNVTGNVAGKDQPLGKKKKDEEDVDKDKDVEIDSDDNPTNKDESLVNEKKSQKQLKILKEAQDCVLKANSLIINNFSKEEAKSELSVLNILANKMFK